jgi:hypothetical protein
MSPVFALKLLKRLLFSILSWSVSLSEGITRFTRLKGINWVLIAQSAALRPELPLFNGLRDRTTRIPSHIPPKPLRLRGIRSPEAESEGRYPYLAK